MQIEFRDEHEWGPARLECSDGHGNAGVVSFPHYSDRRFGGGWQDAEVDIQRHYVDTLEAERRQVEFHLELIRLAELLDLTFAEDARGHKEREAKEREEQEERDRKHQEGVARRCEQLGQYYMQTCRVQREGHKSFAAGELLATWDEEDERFRPSMWLKEKDGNRWDFRADQVSKFEVKDGGRYRKIKLTPIPGRYKE